MLNDFVAQDGTYQPKLPVREAETLVETIGKVKRKAKECGVLVMYANDAHAKDDPEFKLWPEHALKGTYGAEVVDGLKPTKRDIIVEKQDLSVFTNPETQAILKKARVDELYIMGVATEYCIRGAALDAVDLRYKVNVVVDAIAGVDEIILPNGRAVPETKGAVTRALLEMGNKRVRPVYTAQALEELVV